MARKRKGRPIDGVLLVDKPKGYSSNGVLQKVRWLYSAQKAGHTGALDPAATGLLPICFGEATKFTRFLLDADKRYLTIGVLGIETDTLDAEGTVTVQSDVPAVTKESLQALVSQQFKGDIDQIPPMYSALKRDGKKLYELARQGKTVDIQPRPVTLYENKVLSCETPNFHLDVTCSKGTYIRTLVADIGAQIGCGAHVSELRRLEHGQFSIDNATTLESLISMQEAGNIDKLDALLISIDELLADLPKLTLNAHYERLFANGNDIEIQSEVGEARVYNEQGRFLGVGNVTSAQRLQPVRLVAQPKSE